MQEFTEWIGKSPTELISEADEERKRGLSMRDRSIKRYVIGFRKYLQDEKYAPTSVKLYMTGVKSFFVNSEIEYPKLQKQGNRAQTLEENNEIPNKEDIQACIKVADTLEKAIMLTGIASGLSANEIINLKIKDFKKGYDPETGITTLKLRRQKTNFDFITFLTPEASQAINEYLEYRARTEKTGDKERLNVLMKQKVFNDNGYLFIVRNVPNNFLSTMDEKLRQIEESAFLKIYRKVAEKARKNTPKGQWGLIRSHNLRKYFNSTLLNNGCDFFHTNFFMGHKLDETQAAYYRASPEKLRDIYKKYIPYLTVEKALDVSESPEFQQVKRENQILAAETARHVVERSELQEMRSQMEAMQKIINSIPALVKNIDNFKADGDSRDSDSFSKISDSFIEEK